MKKVCLIMVMAILFVGCRKTEIFPTVAEINPELKIASTMGLKLQTSFVTSEVAMNVKSETASTVTIKILDIANKVVSKETVDVKAGDNILKVYTSALPRSAYRLALYDLKGNMLAITDFNKL
jgi:uncharacterized protein YcfL